MKNRGKIFSTVLLILLGSILFFYGLPISKVAGVYDVVPLKDLLNYGLDLTGGVYVVLEAKENDSEKLSDDTMAKAISTIRTRIDSLGVKEPTISQQGSNKIRISIPDIDDQQEALDLIGKTAKLEFIDPNGNVILDGSHIKSAKAESQTSQGSSIEEPIVSLEFTKEGTKLFAAATKEFMNQIIEIHLDGKMISNPEVQAEITDGKAIISNIGDKEEATNLATLIKAGALPVDLEIVEVRSIGPTLGQDSLNSSLKAGLIGVLLVFVFMLLVYRLPGFIADINLMIFLLIYMILMSLLGVTLTLPGIAGIILSVGMAVDANVIVFERIKEELRLGKSKLAAIDSAYKRAFTTIFDSNITTIIAGVVLYFLGSGTIKGFALTLMIGILVSMFTAVVVTKKVIKMVVSTGKFENLKLYGVGGDK